MLFSWESLNSAQVTTTTNRKKRRYLKAIEISKWEIKSWLFIVSRLIHWEIGASFLEQQDQFNHGFLSTLNWKFHKRLLAYHFFPHFPSVCSFEPPSLFLLPSAHHTLLPIFLFIPIARISLSVSLDRSDSPSYLVVQCILRSKSVFFRMLVFLHPCSLIPRTTEVAELRLFLHPCLYPSLTFSSFSRILFILHYTSVLSFSLGFLCLCLCQFLIFSNSFFFRS